MEVIKRFSPEETERRRKEYMETVVKPMVEHIFKMYPKLNGAVLKVAQYWCDEARDAVHGKLGFSLYRNPDIEAWINRLHKLWTDPKLSMTPIEEWFLEGEKTIQLADIKFDAWGEPDIEDLIFNQFGWSDNGNAIPLFAAFCKEGGDQCFSPKENYLPYAIFKRDESNQIETQVVGKMIRPWLDGVMPEREAEHD